MMPVVFEERRWWRLHTVGALSATALSFGWYHFGLEPLSTMSAQRAELRERVSTTAEQLAMVERTRLQLRGQLDDVRQRLEALSVPLASVELQNRRLASITEIGHRHGITISHLQPEGSKAGKRYDTVGIRLRGQGSFAALESFIADVYGSLADVGIADFSMSSGGGGGEVSLEIGLVWYVAPTSKA